MNWMQEAQSAVRGTWRLLLRDTGGFDDFDLSVGGFWRSFAVVFAVAPIYLYAIMIQSGVQIPNEPPPEPASIPLATTGLFVQWFAWPLAMAIVARVTGLTRHYVRYIIVYNWSSILTMVVQMLPVMLLALGGSMLGAATLVTVVVMGVVLYYRWYIAQVALDIGAAAAWALVLGDFVLSIAITKLIG